MKKKSKLAIAAILSVFLIGAVLAITMFQYEIKDASKVVDYFEKTIGVQVSDILVSAKGQVKKSLMHDDYARICIEVDAGELASVIDRFEKAGYSEYTADTEVPVFQNVDLDQKLKSEEIVTRYTDYRFGRVAKTRAIYMFITQDADGKAFVYMFG